MSKWSVHEVRVVQAACMFTFAGQTQQREERLEQRGWSRRRLSADEVATVQVRYVCAR